jgi:transcriptional regulator with XRE-family HTH domain
MSKKDDMASYQEAIAGRVRDARKAAGLSQAEVAEQLGLTDAGYGHYERGRQVFTIDMLVDLGRLFRQPLQYFLGLDSTLTPQEEQLLAAFRAVETEQLRALMLDMVQIAARTKITGS